MTYFYNSMYIAKIFIICIQFLSALSVIYLVLLQQCKGAEMGAAFGSGSAGSLFGVTGSANFLACATAALATVFFICTLARSFLGAHHAQNAAGALGAMKPSPGAATPAAEQERAPSAGSDVPE